MRVGRIPSKISWGGGGGSAQVGEGSVRIRGGGISARIRRGHGWLNKG